MYQRNRLLNKNKDPLDKHIYEEYKNYDLMIDIMFKSL